MCSYKQLGQGQCQLGDFEYVCQINNFVRGGFGERLASDKSAFRNYFVRNSEADRIELPADLVHFDIRTNNVRNGCHNFIFGDTGEKAL